MKRFPNASAIHWLAMAAVAFGIALAARETPRFRRLMLPIWVKTIAGLPYGPYEQNRLDILQPRWRREGLHPAVLIFHGGGWSRGTRHELLDRVCRRYLREGFLVANADYRLGAIEPAVADAVRALEWLRRNAAVHSIDRNRIIVTGESAGAHLALMAAFRSVEPIAAVVNFYGPADLTLLQERPAIRAVLPAVEGVSAARALSPLSLVRTGLPIVFSVHGTSDRTVPPEQTIELTAALRRAGVDSEALLIPDGAHGLSKAHQKIAYEAVFRFLRSRGLLSR